MNPGLGADSQGPGREVHPLFVAPQSQLAQLQSGPHAQSGPQAQAVALVAQPHVEPQLQGLHLHCSVIDRLLWFPGYRSQGI